MILRSLLIVATPCTHSSWRPTLNDLYIQHTKCAQLGMMYLWVKMKGCANYLSRGMCVQRVYKTQLVYEEECVCNLIVKRYVCAPWLSMRNVVYKEECVRNLFIKWNVCATCLYREMCVQLGCLCATELSARNVVVCAQLGCLCATWVYRGI